MLHEFGCPWRLSYFLSWQKLFDYGLDVDDRSAIYSIKFSHSQCPPLHPHYAADCAANPVWTVLAALSKYADFGPCQVAAWVTCPHGYVGLLYPVKDEKHLNMRERFDAGKCVLIKRVNKRDVGH